MSTADSNFVWLPSLGVWSYRPQVSTSGNVEQEQNAGGNMSRSQEQHQLDDDEEASSGITFELRQPSRLLRDIDFGEPSSDKGDSDHVCPICLGTIEDAKAASLWWCMHRFCIVCIEEWSKVRRSCPLCKSEFSGWYQVVKGENRREERLLPPLAYRPSLDYRPSTADENYRFSLSDVRFSTSGYRFSIDDRPSLSAATERRSSSSGRRSEREHVRNTMTFRSRLRLQQLMQPRIARSYRRSIPLPRQRCFLTPTERERLTAESLAERALDWRTSIYRKGLKAVPLNVKRRLEARPYDYDAKVRAERRLKPWITRELTAILGEGDHSLILHLVLALWSEYRSEDIPLNDGQDFNARGRSVSELQKFLGDKATLFWHELRCFAECPYTMDTYDSIVVYVKGDYRPPP